MDKIKNKKRTLLIVGMISLSFLVTSIMTLFGAKVNNFSTSYINKDKWNFIETNFYKSSKFDTSILQAILNGLQIEMYGEEQTDNYYYYDDLKNMPNIKYIAVDKISKRYVTNTSYKSIDEFRKSIDGYVDISFNNQDGLYIKEIGNERNEINTNYHNNGVPYINSNLEVYISLPKVLQPNGSIYHEYDYYNKEINSMKFWGVMGAISLVIFIAFIVLYKKNKYEHIEIENNIFSLYNKIHIDVSLI
ncbi:MAG: hypothetical protein ACRCXA_03330, partial [Peptostreptococcaceae bacterium]